MIKFDALKGITDRLTDQVNYVLNAQWYRKSSQTVSGVYL